MSSNDSSDLLIHCIEQCAVEDSLPDQATESFSVAPSDLLLPLEQYLVIIDNALCITQELQICIDAQVIWDIRQILLCSTQPSGLNVPRLFVF